MKWPTFQPVELLTLSILLSISAFFRLYGLQEKLVFQGDQGRALLAARDILQGQLTLVGPETSVSGFHLGPFFYYLIAPALWLSRFDPIGPAILTSAFGVATTLLLYLYGRRFMSPLSGLVMSLLFAVSPHAIWQSRIALEPSPVPFFSILWLFSITTWLIQGTKKWLLISFLSLFLGTQLNFSFIVLVPATLWLMIPRLPLNLRAKRSLSIGSLLALIFVLLARAALRPITPWDYFIHIWSELTFPRLPVLAVILPGALLIGAGWWLWRTRPTQLATRFFPPFAWFLFSMAGFILKFVSGEHSLAILFPLPALLAGLLFFRISKISLLRQQIALAGAIGLTTVLALQAWWYLGKQEATWLYEYQSVAGHILELSRGEPYRFVYRGHLDVYAAVDDSYVFLLWKAGNPPIQSYRREISAETADQWLDTAEQPAKTIVLYQPPFNFNEYEGYQEATEWNGRWFVVEEMDRVER